MMQNIAKISYIYKFSGDVCVDKNVVFYKLTILIRDCGEIIAIFTFAYCFKTPTRL
jgi:hypothetical protein